jgi:hypothetical protein
MCAQITEKMFGARLIAQNWQQLALAHVKASQVTLAFFHRIKQGLSNTIGLYYEHIMIIIWQSS